MIFQSSEGRSCIVFLCFWCVCFEIVFWSSWGRFWGRFGDHFGIIVGPKSKKKRDWFWDRFSVPALTQTPDYDHGPGLPDSLPNVFDCSNKKQQFEQEITTAAHFWVHFWILVLESVISESMSGKWFVFWWHLWERLVIAKLVACCLLSEGFALMIWHALG